MDYGKLDAALAAALAAALDGRAPQLSVFLHLEPGAVKSHEDALARLGLSSASLQGGIGTATLSPDQVRELSEQPWVRQIRLSAPLRFLGDD